MAATTPSSLRTQALEIIGGLCSAGCGRPEAAASLAKLVGDAIDFALESDNPSAARWQLHDVVTAMASEVVAKDDAQAAVVEVIAYLNARLGLDAKRAFRATGGRKLGGPAEIRARYAECRKSGLSHEDSIARLKAAVDWAMRNWFFKPEMRPYIRPTTLFRVSKFWERS